MFNLDMPTACMNKYTYPGLQVQVYKQFVDLLSSMRLAFSIVCYQVRTLLLRSRGRLALIWE
jgi:hypothetical protein